MKSAEFRMKRWHCYLLMLLHQARWPAFAVALVSVGLIVGGFFISPWAGVAAIGVAAFCIVSVVTLVIMAYGFNSITGVNMATHTLSLDDDRLKVEFEEGEAVAVAKEDLRGYVIYPGGVIVPVEGTRQGWIWIPPTAFNNDDDFQAFLKSLYPSEETAIEI